MATYNKTIAFCCGKCNKSVIRDSEDHDLSGCLDDDEDTWFCSLCLPIKKKEEEEAEQEEEEVCYYIQRGLCLEEFIE